MGYSYSYVIIFVWAKVYAKALLSSQYSLLASREVILETKIIKPEFGGKHYIETEIASWSAIT